MIRVLVAGEDASHHNACAVLFDRILAQTECGGDESAESFIARQESVDTNAQGMITQPRESEVVHIPDGYMVIGGGGVGPNWLGSIVLFR